MAPTEEFEILTLCHPSFLCFERHLFRFEQFGECFFLNMIHQVKKKQRHGFRDGYRSISVLERR